MKIGVLYSGGKDSTLALINAKEFHEIVCLITLVSENKESFMFHTPNIELTTLQAQAMGLPLVRVQTKGQKEEELDDLKKAYLSRERVKIDRFVDDKVISAQDGAKMFADIQKRVTAIDGVNTVITGKPNFKPQFQHNCR